MTAKPGIEVGRDHLSDLVYADDTAFLLKSTTDAITSLSGFSETASVLGLQISWLKTNLQNIGTGAQPPAISVDGNLVESVNSFIYHVSAQSPTVTVPICGDAQSDVAVTTAQAGYVLNDDDDDLRKNKNKIYCLHAPPPFGR